MHERTNDQAEGRIEKYILRKAFDDPADPYLPAKILWRQKEQFSDGCAAPALPCPAMPCYDMLCYAKQGRREARKDGRRLSFVYPPPPTDDSSTNNPSLLPPNQTSVGYGWIDALRDHAAAAVSDQQLDNAPNRFLHNPPLTKEAYFYRAIFEEAYPSPAAAATVPGGPSIACSTPRAMEWDESFKGRADPSGRAVAAVHDDAYSEEFNAAGKEDGAPASPVRAGGKRKAEAQGGK